MTPVAWVRKHCERTPIFLSPPTLIGDEMVVEVRSGTPRTIRKRRKNAR